MIEVVGRLDEAASSMPEAGEQQLDREGENRGSGRGRKARDREVWTRVKSDEGGIERVDRPARRRRHSVGGIELELSERAAYFNDEGTFQPPRLGEDLVDVLGLARGPGGDLWFDAGGVYRVGAEAVVGELVRQVLGGDTFRANRLSEVLSYCRTLYPTISSNPPPEHLLNVANGVLDLDSLELLRPADVPVRFTYQVPVEWRPGARCPAIRTFIRQVVPGDCVSLVAEVFGLTLLATPRYRRAVMLLGGGSNGKSIMLALNCALLGVENVSSVTLQRLAEDRFAMAQLFGTLANVAGDLDSRPLARSDAFKMLTGGDLVTAERKFGQPFQFVSYATLVFSANEWPVSHDQTDAYFTRWIAIPFPNRYREDDGPLMPGDRVADPKLLERLTTPSELEGLLVSAVHGARRLRRRGGFQVPDSVRAAVAEYREWADTVVAWSLESVSEKPGHKIPRAHVFGAYQEWCKDNGRSSVSSKKFWPRLREALGERGIQLEEGKSSGVREVVGASLLGGGR